MLCQQCVREDSVEADLEFPGQKVSSFAREPGARSLSIENLFDLLSLHPRKPCNKLIDRSAVSKVFEERGNRYAGPGKDPYAANSSWVPLNRIAIFPT